MNTDEIVSAMYDKVNDIHADVRVIKNQIEGKGQIIDQLQAHEESIQDMKKFQWKITGGISIISFISAWISSRFNNN